MLRLSFGAFCFNICTPNHLLTCVPFFQEDPKEQYGKGNIHINGMENFWSWAKEQMFKYHGVFRENLFYYLKEMEWKFNHRALRPEEKAIELAKIFPCVGAIGNLTGQAGF